MKTKIILSGILMFIAGFAVGYLVRQPKKAVPTEAIRAETTEQSPKPVSAPSKFFDLFDTFTADKDMGGMTIRFSYPDQHLLVFEYPTSQESFEFGVYDYKNNVMYRPTGGSSQDQGVSEPRAFVGSDKLLTYTSGEDTFGKAVVPMLSITDFKGNQVKALLRGETVQEVYGNYGESVIIRTGPQNNSSTKNYILDVKTLELKPYPSNQ